MKFLGVALLATLSCIVLCAAEEPKAEGQFAEVKEEDENEIHAVPKDHIEEGAKQAADSKMFDAMYQELDEESIKKCQSFTAQQLADMLQNNAPDSPESSEFYKCLMHVSTETLNEVISILGLEVPKEDGAADEQEPTDAAETEAEAEAEVPKSDL